MINDMGYKNICTKCRISLSEGTNYELFNRYKTCLTCRGKMYYVNEKFEAPKKCNDKEWKLIEFLSISGYDFEMQLMWLKDLFTLSFQRICKRQKHLCVS